MRKSNYVSNYMSIKKYNDNYYKLTYIPHYIYTYQTIKTGNDELDEKLEEIEKENINLNKLSNNLSRAKSKVFEYSMSNDFDYFITLTLDPLKYDRGNLKKYIKDLGQFIRNYRTKYNIDVQYLLIPERHKDGSWHMHGLIKGIPSHLFTINENGYLDWLDYKKKFGFCSLSAVKNQVAVSKYITKYISKSFNDEGGVTEKNKKLYYNSRGLLKSEKILEGQALPELLEKIDFDFTNKYVSLKDMNKEEYNSFISLIK